MSGDSNIGAWIQFAKLTTAAGELAPFPYIKGVAGCIVTILEVIELAGKNNEVLRNFAESIGTTIRIIRETVEAHGDTSAERFRDVCEDLQKYLESLIAELSTTRRKLTSITRFLTTKKVSGVIDGYKRRVYRIKADHLIREPMNETENQETSFSFDSPISKDDNPASKPSYDQIPPAIFDEIYQGFWDRGKSLTDINHLAPKHPQSVIDHLQQLMDTELMGDGQDYWRKCCTKRMLALVKKHGILPTSFSCLDARSEGSTAVWGGGFADIWKGRMGDTLICIKVLRIFIDNGIKERARVIKNFCREALVWRNLKHPNVLPFLGVSTKLFVPSFCLISPWMENGNIMSFLAANPGHDRLVSIKEVASGMAYLHSLDPPIVHADIRGANILVTDDYRCCLADFGLALAVETQAPGSSSLGLNGSIRWLAPEVLDIRLFDHKYVAARDVYAFGCTVIEIYSGKPPFSHIPEAAIILEVLMSVCTGKTKPQTDDLGRIGEVVDRCLVTRAADRLGATEVVRMLEDLG
ncbi:uncharacterized protein ARMOST_02657 [Armillaria ostoyae]|uniref:Protein kinase domain-containing protein n=1 Tax=Armillaria ostoyae TaxID=47428 RepID=A0A284QSA4_ARMOS|nr:uncharacterized protein ARMOST_02657 [Armillaria ostoyae]